LALAFALGLLSIWVVVPAPTRAFLPLGVAVPELSPVLALAALALAVGAWWGRPKTVSRAASVVAVLAALVLAWPALQLPGALGRSDAAMAAAGFDAGESVVSRTAAFNLLDLATGINRGRSRVWRDVRVSDAPALLVADVYAARDARNAPVLVQIYGGAWQRGEPGDDEAFARYFAGRGFVVAAVDYRHAPAWRWPAQIDDVHLALAWVRSNVRQYGGDPDRMVLIGRSAGAQLALVAAYQAGTREVAGVVSLYGPVFLADGWRVPPRPDPLNVRAVLESFLGGTPDQVPAAYAAASPITYLSPSSPPTLLVYGARDHIVDIGFARRLDKRLRAARVPGALIELPWAEHAFDALPNGLSAQVALFYTERFLDSLFRQSSAKWPGPS
jgi:acetyl esterase/lipase